MTTSIETADKAVSDVAKKRLANSKPSAKKSKVGAKTNFDNTYADIIFPFIFSTPKKGKVEANTGSLEKAKKSSTIKVKVSLVKEAKIDSTAGIMVNESGTPQGGHTGFGAVKPAKVTFRSVLKKRTGKTVKASSSRTYAKQWRNFSVPKSATAIDVIAWIQKNWGVKPDQLQIGEKLYNIKPRKKVYNNPSAATSAASAR